MGIFKRIFKTELYKLNLPKINIIHLIRNAVVRTHLKCLYSHQ